MMRSWTVATSASPSFNLSFFTGTFRRGSISIFPLPSPGELAAHTATVIEANGFRPREERPAPLPAAIRHVVLIVKENRTFDEVFGDIRRASNGAVVGRPDDLKGQGIVAFVTVKGGIQVEPSLREELRGHVARVIGAIAKPDEVRFAEALPKTRSGKIMRRLLKEIASGRSIRFR